MTPKQLCDRLEWMDVDGDVARDCRDVLRSERFSLTAALRTGNAEKIAKARDEALRVVRLWADHLPAKYLHGVPK